MALDLVDDATLWRIAASFDENMRGFFLNQLKLTEAEIYKCNKNSEDTTDGYFKMLKEWKRKTQESATTADLLHYLVEGKVHKSSQTILEKVIGLEVAPPLNPDEVNSLYHLTDTDIISDAVLWRLAESFQENMRGVFLNYLEVSEAEIYKFMKDGDGITEEYYYILKTWKRKKQNFATPNCLLNVLSAAEVDKSSQKILEEFQCNNTRAGRRKEAGRSKENNNNVTGIETTPENQPMIRMPQTEIQSTAKKKLSRLHRHLLWCTALFFFLLFLICISVIVYLAINNEGNKHGSLIIGISTVSTGLIAACIAVLLTSLQ